LRKDTNITAGAASFFYSSVIGKQEKEAALYFIVFAGERQPIVWRTSANRLANVNQSFGERQPIAQHVPADGIPL
jgi:hypothetical protein